jgi:hypothetical protein
MTADSARRVLFQAGIASLCITAAIAIFALVTGDLDEDGGRVLATTSLISAYSFLAIPAGVLLDRGRARPLALITVALVLVAFLLWMWEVWILEWDDDDGLWKAIVDVTTFAIACAQTAGLLTRSRPGDHPAVENLAVAACVLIFVIAGLVAIAVGAEIEDDGYYRFVGVLTVLNVLAITLRPLVRRSVGDAAAAGAPGRPPSPSPRPQPASSTAPDGKHRFTCTLDQPIDAATAHGLPGTLADNGRTLDVELEAATFAAALGAAVALVEDGSRARVVRIERSG